ncbi:glycoside hydrolase family 5 protein [Saccharopolyspora mangrovi]|uniref:Uncharacterized protein n=1 Tax=Saccharopolyspora mangrovi TaxID=3082379 RepID=A0ABU6AJD7_9PSEU|nr:hypothetical protein [Saccharopolyspora sp. S2-29]MEB3371667.1 hypothetical protein [Saccharopolyspora sp. S2-29]
MLFLDGNRYATDFSAFDEPLPNAVYTTHDYALPGIAAEATGYPGATRGEHFDRDVLERTFLRRTEFMRSTGTPIWIGEFGPLYPCGEPEPWRLQVLADQLEIYREHAASWSLWTYKDIGLQGLVHVREDSPYLARIAEVLEAKRRLGVDSWGGTDAGVRDVLDPVEAAFDREFPDFQPYPWGKRKFAEVLVRHILLAEPLVQRFAQCFAGVTPEEARTLARSFRHDRCAERELLTGLLRRHLKP